jgi:mRNA-degrading endonuclease RelE of RelBE toxin-antitoxin system
MSYTLKRYPQVKKQLRLVPERIEKDVAQAILDLIEEPYPPNAEALRDQSTSTWKIKIDRCRIFYRGNDQEQIVVVISVKQRQRDTYRKSS